MFLDGVFYTQYYLNGTLVSDTPRNLDIVGTGITFDTTTGRARYTLSGGGGGSSVGGGPGEVQYNNGGVLDGASNIKVVGSESGLAFSGTVTVGGAVNVPHNSKISRGRNSAGNADVDIFTWGAATNRLWIGDSALMAGANFLLALGGDLSINVNGTTEYTFDATAITFNGNNAVGVGFISSSGVVSSAGFVRVSHGVQDVLNGRNFANTQNVPLLRWGAFVSNMIYIGSASSDAGKVASIRWGVDTGGSFAWEINSGALANLSASGLDMGSTPILFGTGTRANSGSIRFAKNPGTLLAYIAHDGVSTRSAISAAGDGSTFTDLTVGDSNATTGNTTLFLCAKTGMQFQIAGANEYAFDATAITLNGNNLVGAGFLSMSGTVAGVGAIRLPFDLTHPLIASKNTAGTADVQLIGFDGVNMNVGDSQQVGTMQFQTKTGGSFLFLVNNSAVASISATGDLGAAKATLTELLGLTAQTTATTATAGSQTLPANPVGFIVLTIGAGLKKIPYYNP